MVPAYGVGEQRKPRSAPPNDARNDLRAVDHFPHGG